MRHVIFMYQILWKFSGKEHFFRQNAHALLTLGHNVGWKSQRPNLNTSFYAPYKDEVHHDLLKKDSSLLETSSCLIFPQGLVVVHEPGAIIYLGGHSSDNSHYSPADISYDDYWRMIFRLFVRIVEARLLLRMVNRYLSDCHKTFLTHRDTLSSCGDKNTVYNQIIQIGWLLQRMKEHIITPEVSGSSFVRHKLIRFMKEFRLNEHMRHINSEFQDLNRWLNEASVAKAAKKALCVAIIAVVIAVVSMLVSVFLKYHSENDQSNQTATESQNKNSEGRVESDRIKENNELNVRIFTEKEKNSTRRKVDPVKRPISKKPETWNPIYHIK